MSVIGELIGVTRSTGGVIINNIKYFNVNYDNIHQTEVNVGVIYLVKSKLKSWLCLIPYLFTKRLA